MSRPRRAFGTVPSFRQIIVGTSPPFTRRFLGEGTQFPLSFSGISGSYRACTLRERELPCWMCKR